ncbi:kelch repeat-containing protein [Sorangium sp. So ce542]|uniref:Kelch repeat-containing protein n=1 Tax=Sorangium sp. So ce542 TaxID=3133316 RepID=UPI003F642DD4
MTRPRFNQQAVRLLDGRVLVIAGDSAVGSTEIYDPATDTFAPAGAMTDDRFGFGVTLLQDGRVLVTGGYSYLTDRTAVPVDTAEVFEPVTNTWTAVASMPHWRAGHDAPLLPDGRVAIPRLDGVNIYDPIADTWTVGAAPEIEGCCDTATLLPSGKILVMAMNLYDTNQAAIYDPTDDTWTPAAEMGEGNDYEATLLPDGRVLAIAVYGMADRNVEVYDPAAGTWSFVPGLPNTLRAPRDAEGRVNLPLQERAMTVLPDGRVLVSGGMEEFYENCAPWGDCYHTREYSNATYLYDPSTDRWTAGPSLSVGRSGHSATALLDGSVLIAGGTVPPSPYMYGEISASAERLFVGGAPCASSAECATGFCVDGVCCTSACDAGPCDACSIAAGAAIEGECTLLTGPACDDGNACTEADICDGGICSGTPSDAGACATGAGGAGGAGGGAGGGESTAASTSAASGGAGAGGAGGAGGGESTAASTSAASGGAGAGGAGGAGGGESTAASTSAGAGTGSGTPVTAGGGCNFGETRSSSAAHIGLVALFSLARLMRRRRLASSPSPGAGATPGR